MMTDAAIGAAITIATMNAASAAVDLTFTFPCLPRGLVWARMIGRGSPRQVAENEQVR